MNESTASNCTVPGLPEANTWFYGQSFPDSLAVAWSGGADSTALLLGLHTLGIRVCAWHVDHAWHDASRQHAQQLARQAEVWGIPYDCVRLQYDYHANLEAEARKLRYAQFSRWAEQQGVQTLCLAHHLDDQAETVCLRLLQGAGVMGCMGMRAERHIGNLRLLRPLLHLRKLELEQALKLAGIAWLSDPGNADLRFWRNRLRHGLFPRIRQAGMDPADLFLRWQKQATRIGVELSREADAVTIGIDQGYVWVSWEQWSSIPSPVRVIILQRMMSALHGEGTVMGRRHLELVENWLAQGGKGGVDLSRSRLWHEKERLHLCKARAKLY